MTRLLVILIALLLAWMWISRAIRGLLGSRRGAEARAFARLLRVLRRTAAGRPDVRGGAGRSGAAAAPGSGPARAALVQCRRCGVHVPEAQLTAGVCGSCLNEDRTAQG